MSILVAPTEPPQLKELGEVSSKPEQYGVDILLSDVVGIQRKQFPDDFLNSLRDGRLQREAMLMKQLPRAILLLEGKPRWTLDGGLVDNNWQFTRRQLRGLCWSFAWEFGVHVDYTDTLTDTAYYIQHLKLYLEKGEHLSLVRRIKPKDGWNIRLTGKDWGVYLLQSLPGVGPKVAEAIYDRFGCLPLDWTCTKEELLSVPGVGERRLERIWNIFRDKGGR